MIEIIESKVSLELNGISNFESIEVLAKERAKKIKETIIDETNYKLIEKEMKELLEPAKILRKVAASFKKEGELKVKEVYDKIKDLENIIRSEIEEKTKEIELFIIEDKKRKIESKKAEVAEMLNEMNEEILQMETPYKTFKTIEFLEDWAIKSVLAIKEEITRLYNEQATTHRSCNERLKYADMKAKILKSEYSIENNIDYMQVLGLKIYDLTISEVDEILENKAQEIQTLEIEQEEKLREKIRIEEENRLKKIEAEKEKEAKKIKEAEEKAKQEEINRAVAEERKKAEEEKRIEREKLEEEYRIRREKEEKERLEKEKIEKAKIESERKKAEELRIEQERQAKLKAKQENKYTFDLKIKDCSLEQSKQLKEFLEKNKFNFEIAK